MTDIILPEDQVVKSQKFIELFNEISNLAKNYNPSIGLSLIDLGNYTSSFRYYIIKQCLAQGYKINIWRDDEYDNDEHIELRSGMTDKKLFEYTSHYLIYYCA